MPPSHVFKNVVLSAVFRDQPGETFHLQRAEVSTGGDKRHPVSLKLFAGIASGADGGAVITVELTQREAYAFSEWLDRSVTQARLE